MPKTISGEVKRVYRDEKMPQWTVIQIFDGDGIQHVRTRGSLPAVGDTIIFEGNYDTAQWMYDDPEEPNAMKERILEMLKARLPASLGESFIEALANDLASSLGGGTDNAAEFAKMKERLNRDNFYITGGRLDGNRLHVYANHPLFSDVQDDWEFRLG